jgi:MATE family multidrug resistance protein
VLLAGLLPHPHLAMSVMGITINLHAVAFLTAQGLGGAAATCVAQDLGAGQPQKAIHNTKVSMNPTVSM